MRLSRTCSVSLSKRKSHRARLRISRMKSLIHHQVQARQVPPHHPHQVVQKTRQKVKKKNQAAEALPLPNQPVQAIQVPVTKPAAAKAVAL